MQGVKAAHAARDRGVDQSVQALESELLEHHRLLVIGWADVAMQEVFEGLESLSCRLGHGGLLVCSRVFMRCLLDVLPALSSDLRVSPPDGDFHLRCSHRGACFPELPRQSGMSA